jgi:hypothetical protein
MSNLLPIPGDTRPLTAQQQANQSAYLAWNTRSAAEIKHLYTSGYPHNDAPGPRNNSFMTVGATVTSGFECL